MTDFLSVPHPARRRRRPAASALVAWLGLVSSIPAAAADPLPAGVGKLVAERSAALVTVQSTAQLEAAGGLGSMLAGGEEFFNEATCLMVGARGIVLCSHAQLTGLTGLMQRFLGPLGRGVNLSVNPMRLTVLLNGNAGERFDARLLAQDTDLDLAWLEIANPGNRAFSAIDLTRGAEPSIGDPLVVLQRLEEHFDRAVVAFAGQIGGMTRLPRPLYIPTVLIETGFGLPVFSPAGDLLGVTVLQLPREDEAAAGGGTLGAMRQATRWRSLARAVILPASAVSSATARALASAARSAPPPAK